MDTWAPLFSKIVDSSIWDEPDWVVKVFMTMLAKKDKDHVVRANAYMIGKWARKDEKTVLEALEILSSPDTKRLEKQPFEGRRIQQVEDGWLILNGAKYRKVLADAVKREQKRLWAEKQRKHGKPLPGESAYCKLVGEVGKEPDAPGVVWPVGPETSTTGETVAGEKVDGTVSATVDGTIE